MADHVCYQVNTTQSQEGVEQEPAGPRQKSSPLHQGEHAMNSGVPLRSNAVSIGSYSNREGKKKVP